MTRRKLLYVTGTRADFGLMLPILRALDRSDYFTLELVVAGMHLSPQFGYTVREVEASELHIAARAKLPIENDSAAGMAACAGDMAAFMGSFFSSYRPDILLLLGDRSEMLASALPAVVAGIPIVHLCGGERSGTVDESIRHAVSKLANLHLVANSDAAGRLVAMGEEPWRIHQVGAPGLVGLRELAQFGRAELLSKYGLDPSRSYALVLFHPVVQDAEKSGLPVRLALAELQKTGIQSLCLMPNADHGTGQIRDELGAVSGGSSVQLVTHMARPDFVSALAQAALMIGNSSSGIVEAATFGTPVVNVGDRQHGRLRNSNVIDADPDPVSLAAGIETALRQPRTAGENIYGDGQTDARVVEILANLDWGDPRLLKKQITF
ncbi:MAG TPA: UDP-N-acetylglucosamine 2-epimerase [Sphingomicrobium sp.]|nr:UDP-N-acetylglucosamine 2-epimerase [Sphingomicrobium sp.]